MAGIDSERRKGCLGNLVNNRAPRSVYKQVGARAVSRSSVLASGPESTNLE